MDKFLTLSDDWLGFDEATDADPVLHPYETLAERLSDLSDRQLGAMRRTLRTCMALPPELMDWLARLIAWERKRREVDREEPVPVFHPVQRVDAIFALTALAAEFRALPSWQVSANAPLVRLFEAACNVAECTDMLHGRTLH